MVCPLGEWVYKIVEELTLHCFSTFIENLEQAMQVSGGVLWGMCAHTCTHAHVCTCTQLYMQTCRNAQRGIIFLCCPSLFNVSLLPPSLQVHNKDATVLEPHPHHTLLAFFGEDTAETEEEIDNTHMWCEV